MKFNEQEQGKKRHENQKMSRSLSVGRESDGGQRERETHPERERNTSRKRERDTPPERELNEEKNLSR